MKKYLGLLAINAVLLHPVYAGCDKLSVVITNQTNAPCVIQDWSLEHGSIESFPAPKISPGATTQAIASQAHSHGPDVTFKYSCGDREIVIRSQQNYCALMAGKITGKLVSRNPASIIAFATTREGSYKWSESGQINWKILDF